MTLLSVDELSVTFSGPGGSQDMPAVSGVSFTIGEGEVTGLVGESGCGKSVTSLALMGLLPKKGVRVGGRADFDGTDLLSLRRSAMRELRGRQMAMIFQDPLSSLNPVVPIGVQVTEILTRHRGLRGAAARKEAAALLDRVGIPDPTRRLKEYPHQLSGGMRQRALIAMAVACAPRLLIADEPTTALDVTIQAQILELLKELVDQQGTALLMITHDLGVVAGLCDRVNVLYAGKVVESAPRHPLFAAPAHPYAHGLLGSIPRLDAPRGEPLNPVRGSINDTIAWSDGCAFAPRCDYYTLDCLEGTPTLGPLDDPNADHQVRCVNPVTEATDAASEPDGDDTNDESAPADAPADAKGPAAEPAAPARALGQAASSADPSAPSGETAPEAAKGTPAAAGSAPEAANGRTAEPAAGGPAPGQAAEPAAGENVPREANDQTAEAHAGQDDPAAPAGALSKASPSEPPGETAPGDANSGPDAPAAGEPAAAAANGRTAGGAASADGASAAEPAAGDSAEETEASA
jgi:peptide/nickel transport system ATP-binding protein